MNEQAQAQVLALPFVDRIYYEKVYFKPITWNTYTVSGMYLDLDMNELRQEKDSFEDKPHPHAVEKDEGWDEYLDEDEDTPWYVGLCSNQSNMRSFVRQGRWVEAATEAFLVASTFTFWDAPYGKSEMSRCHYCGELGKFQDNDLRIVSWYGRRVYPVPVHIKCYNELRDMEKEQYEREHGDD